MNSEFDSGRGAAELTQPGGAIVTPSGHHLIIPSPHQPLPLLHPMEIGEMLDEAIDLYKRNFRLFFGITILITAPFSLLQLAVIGSEDARLTVMSLAFLASFLTYSALTLAGWERFMGRPITLLATFRRALRPSFRVFLGFLVLVLALAVLLVPFILPGIIVRQSSPDVGGVVIILGVLVFLLPATLPFLWSQLLVPVAVMEKHSFGALQRCRHLARGNVWRLIVLSVGLIAVLLVETAVVGSLYGLLIAFTGIKPFLPPEPGNTGATVTYAAAILVNTLLLSAWRPIWCTVVLLAYLDLRIRREAYDLELIASAVEAKAAAAVGAARNEE